MTSHPASMKPGAWGPVVSGGRRLWWLRPVLLLAGLALTVMTVTLGLTGSLLYWVAESNLTRVPVAELADSADADQPLNVLVVGSDSREGLSEERRRELHLGAFEGQRSDTMLLVSITPDRRHATVISFPRDLLVMDDGEPAKLAHTFGGGAGNVVDVISENFDVPIHHYVEVSVPGFLEVVETVGNVELCLEQPLVDEDSGADLPAGCQELTPEEALSYVRSREGARGDFRRIERQQQFLKAMLEEVVEARTLVDLPRLFRLVEDAAGNVTTDEGLGIHEMRRLAQDLRGLASGDIPMTFVPGYPRNVGGVSHIVLFEPGAEALFAAVRRGEPVADPGTREERAELDLLLWHGDDLESLEIVKSTLHWAGFGLLDVAPAPDPPAATTVYFAPGFAPQAEWVAATLGAPIAPWPQDVVVPRGASVAVAVGEDAGLDPGPEDAALVMADPEG